MPLYTPVCVCVYVCMCYVMQVLFGFFYCVVPVL